MDVHNEKITHINHGEGKIIYLMKESNKETFEVGFKTDKNNFKVEFDCYNYNKLKEQWSNLKLSYLTVYYKMEILKYLEPKKNQPKPEKNHSEPKKQYSKSKKKESPLFNLLEIEEKQPELENKEVFIKNKLQNIYNDFKKEINSRY